MLTFVCLKQRVIKTRDEVFAIVKSSGKVLTPAKLQLEPVKKSDGDVAEAAPEKQEVRKPDLDIEKKREKAKNTLHLAFLILCDPAKSRIMDGLGYLIQDLRLQFGRCIQIFNNRRRSMEWAISTAAGTDHASTLQSIVSALDDSGKQEKIGFLSSESYGDDRIESETDSDRLVAQVLWDATRELLNFRYVGFLYFTCSLPFFFALLLSDTPADVVRCLATLKLWWEALDKLEHFARANRQCRNLLIEIHWARCPWIRMILLGLREARFLCVPDWIHEKVSNRVNSWLSSVGVEYLNRAIRSAEKK